MAWLDSIRGGVLCALTMMGVAPAAPQDSVAALPDVETILARCTECHGQGRQRKSLRLDNRAAMLRGGRSGPAIVSGNADASLVVQRVSGVGKRMPPIGEALTAAQIGTLRAWIDGGAPRLPHETTDDPRPWAQRPIVRPAVPAGAAQPIDAFVRARLAGEGLTAAARQEASKLLRRVSLDLIGLPPSVVELDAFLADQRPDAYARAVDRLLASPHFGERWASMWLDLARYADTKGYEKDDRRSIWRYRDYVIDAFNRDLPFDQFTIQQIAGDLLPTPTQDELVATAFHRNTMTNDEGGTDDEEFRVAAVIDRVNTTMATWMGTTIGCCQCHDHKYDAFSHQEYFALFAFFDNTEDDDHASERPTVAAPTSEQRDALAVRHKLRTELVAATQAWDAERQAAFARWLQVRNELRPPVAPIEADPARLRALYRDTAPELLPLREAIVAVDAQIAAIKVSTVPILRELPAERARVTRLHRRGSFLDQGDPVTRAVPAALHALPADAPRDRLGLARWLVAPDNPLTARVVANRFWEQLFGAGLVETSDDFGVQGEPPSHPELLDWLASEFVARGWSMKELLKVIVTSETYAQASDVTADGLARDPGNRWLARGPRGRLSAEAVRDQALHVAGLLSEKIGGPSVMPPQPSGLWTIIYSNDAWHTSPGEDRHRRALYTFWRRTSPYPSLMMFDAPSRDMCVVRRLPTNTPLQALVTLNDPVFVEAAIAFATRMQQEGGPDAAARLVFGFRACTGRTPNATELDRLNRLYLDERQRGDGPLADERAWRVLANVLLNLDETLTKA